MVRTAIYRFCCVCVHSEGAGSTGEYAYNQSTKEDKQCSVTLIGVTSSSAQTILM